MQQQHEHTKTRMDKETREMFLKKLFVKEMRKFMIDDVLVPTYSFIHREMGKNRHIQIRKAIEGVVDRHLEAITKGQEKTYNYMYTWLARWMNKNYHNQISKYKEHSNAIAGFYENNVIATYNRKFARVYHATIDASTGVPRFDVHNNGDVVYKLRNACREIYLREKEVEQILAEGKTPDTGDSDNGTVEKKTPETEGKARTFVNEMIPVGLDSFDFDDLFGFSVRTKVDIYLKKQRNKGIEQAMGDEQKIQAINEFYQKHMPTVTERAFKVCNYPFLGTAEADAEREMEKEIAKIKEEKRQQLMEERAAKTLRQFRCETRQRTS